MSTTTATRSPYARMFALPGAKAFCLSAALARLPMSMMSLGIVLALNHLYNNWTIAGSMSGAYILAVAAVTPFYARLFDRFGQRKVGRTALAVQVVAMLVFAFNWQGIPPDLIMLLALGTSMSSIVFTSISSSRAHSRNGNVDWGAVRTIAPGIVAGTLCGTYLASILPTRFLQIFFVAFLMFVAIQISATKNPGPRVTCRGWAA